MAEQSAISSEQGQKLLRDIKDSYKWKEMYPATNQEFMTRISQLFASCQEHTSQLSALLTPEAKKEADAIVNELITVRNHWGPNLFPPHIKTMTRELFHITLGGKQYRVNCVQFFEPVPYYDRAVGRPNKGELMKLFRFSVYDTATNEIIFRYFLERSNVIGLFHVLCYADEGRRGQIQPYGPECPSYWQQREAVINDMTKRFGKN